MFANSTKCEGYLNTNETIHLFMRFMLQANKGMSQRNQWMTSPNFICETYIISAISKWSREVMHKWFQGFFGHVNLQTRCSAQRILREKKNRFLILWHFSEFSVAGFEFGKGCSHAFTVKLYSSVCFFPITASETVFPRSPIRRVNAARVMHAPDW